MNGSMASACATTRPIASAPSACPSSKKTAAARFRQPRTVSCRATGGGSDKDGLLWMPRRDAMLTGLSGVAAGLAWYPGLASAGGTDQPPPTSPCEEAMQVTEKDLLCTDANAIGLPCPLLSTTAPIDFKQATEVTRVRQPVHRLCPEYQAKYKEAVRRMKALPAENPLSFTAQAAIHQAYCDSYYKYQKETDLKFDVHFSWLFAPWHRMYIYFYEKALGDLIGDKTFALPFWNWDTPDGMVVSALFKDSFANPLYDPNRNQANLDGLVDLDYLSADDKSKPPIPFNGPKDDEYLELVNKNLCTIYNQQVRKGPLSFLGEKYCTDIEDNKSAGTLESKAHTAMHVWVGKMPAPGTPCTLESGGVMNHSEPDPEKNGEYKYNCSNDMGFLGSAGNDPLFYSHHSNVDRMWHLWSTRFGGGDGITEKKWLDTSFVFYDDVKNPHKVRIKFSDVLHTHKLGYKYDDECDKDLPWLRPKFTKLVPHGKDSGAPARSSAAAPVFPVDLTRGKVLEVPAVAVPAKEPGKELLLVIDGIEFDPQVNNKFDVAINVPADKALKVGPQYKEYAGSFAVVPGSGAGMKRKVRVTLCITDVLYDLDAENDSTVDVVIVPRTAAKVTLSARPTIMNRK